MNTQIWDWAYAWEILPILAEASVVTLQATLMGFVLALLLGLVFAVGRMAGPAWLRLAVAGLVEFVRSTPLLIQIFFLYYVMPEFGLTIDAMPAGVLALGLHYGAYCSEVYRAGLENVPKGQWEAAYFKKWAQMDSTVAYVSQRKGDVFTTAQERDSESQYNTYKYTGLPPGPIAARTAATRATSSARSGRPWSCGAELMLTPRRPMARRCRMDAAAARWASLPASASIPARISAPTGKAAS